MKERFIKRIQKDLKLERENLEILNDQDWLVISTPYRILHKIRIYQAIIDDINYIYPEIERMTKGKRFCYELQEGIPSLSIYAVNQGCYYGHIDFDHININKMGINDSLKLKDFKKFIFNQIKR